MSTEFSGNQDFWDSILYFLSMISFYEHILRQIILHFYHCCFHIQYNFYSKYYWLLLSMIIIFFMLQNVPNISDYIFGCFLIVFLFSFFYLKRFFISLTVVSSISFLVQNIFYIFNYVAFYLTFHHYMLWKKIWLIIFLKK